MLEKEKPIRWIQFIKDSSLMTIFLITLYGVFLLGDAQKLAYAATLAERRIPEQHITTNPEGYNASMWELVNIAEETWEKELGLTFKKDVMDHAEVVSKAFFGGQFEVMVMSYAGRPVRLDPGFILPLRFYATCKNYYPKIPKEECPGGGGAFNTGGYYNPELNKLIENLEEVFDYNERKKISDKVLEITVRDRATLVICGVDILHLMNTQNWKDEVNGVGESLSCFWNTIGIKPKSKNRMLKIGTVNPMETINPMAALISQDLRALRLIYDRLMEIDPQGKPINWIAEEVKAVDGPKGPKTVITIKLREKLKFHDGVPLTADDVKFTFDFAMKYNAPGLSTYLRRVDRVETEGKYVVKIYLKSPWSGISHILFARMFIIPKHIWEKVPETMSNPIQWANPKPIGSGPFKFESWERGSQMVFSKFEGYFYPVEPERVVRVDFGGNEQLATAIERGEIDIQWDVPMPAIIALRSQNKENVKLCNAQSHGHMCFDLRLDKRPYSDLVFRKALEYCLPRKKMIEQVYHGFATYAVSTIPPGNEAWHNPKVIDLASEYNPQKARQILKEAGYEWDAEGHLCYPE